MKHKPIPWAILLTGVLYYGLLVYWQSDELQMASGSDPYNAAVFGLLFSVVYLAYCMLCFQRDLPSSFKEMPFIGRFGKLTGWLTFAAIAVYYVRPDAWGGYDEGVGFFLVGIILLGFGAAAILTCFMWEGDDSSRLYALRRFVDVYPTITKPERHVRFNEKMWTTTFVLIIYFAMTNVMLFGLSGQALDLFSGFRSIMAGASGTIMHLGIGPIVTGSIIMQLFAGAKIIRLDLSNSDDKAMYQGVQKLLVLIMIPIESIPQTYGFLDPSEWLIDAYGLGWANFVIVAQLFAGSYLVFLLDELVSKWGIGSGISLFIAAGVAQSTFVGTLSPLATTSGVPYSIQNPPSGTLPMIFYMFRESSNYEMIQANGFEVMLLTHVNPVAALVSSIIVFLVVAYAESSKLELPLTHGKVRGHRGKYPIRLVYASNIPVILMAALLANINMFTLLFWSHPTLSKTPILGQNGWASASAYIGTYDPGQTTASGGFAWYASMVNGVNDWLIPLLNQQGDVFGHSLTQMLVHVVFYVALMTVGSMVFAKFWIDTTNMGTKDVAKQIERTGMQIPGFRKNPKVLEKILENYIPPVTYFSGAFVGLLAAGADLLGTVGNATGTGLLLAVGIILRTYEQIQKEQAMEMHPMIRQFFGAD
ncbi:preprotein translocase subunit SecY [Candidatus Poseidonia alphae]|uniref:preprotein translocase subunit SecY n=1 Tax=Candidatus Poseidonia alphae TaxID=1915863 RepID=UPI0023260663|nr:preprotein translocase subunit SecY [Candidatus Poseidonia alphae]MDA8749412.1 preprotein translocase subunit SecY [Candidatus Poseidonia alphae]MDA8759495.1 preprotein translocase subunit SecY [Candidatus Poseidonia alphae]MDA8839002.1 preprotein translocase subunit SecY [Candidatus Poseidonia alphae]